MRLSVHIKTRLTTFSYVAEETPHWRHFLLIQGTFLVEPFWILSTLEIKIPQQSYIYYVRSVTMYSET